MFIAKQSFEFFTKYCYSKTKSIKFIKVEEELYDFKVNKNCGNNI